MGCHGYNRINASAVTLIIDRYLFKETILTWLSVLLVLLLIFCSKHFVRYMSDAVAGELPIAMIFQLLSLFTLSYLVLIIPFAFYLAVIIALGRLYKDSEITAAEACGIGIPRIARSILQLSLMLAILVGLLSLWVAPWAELKQYEIRQQASSEAEFSFISPGKFHEIRGGKGVFYIESKSADQSRMLNIFVQIQEENKTDVFSAKSGYLKKINSEGDYFIVLENGFRFEYLPDGSFRQHEYQESGVRINQSVREFGTDKIVAQPTWSLFSMNSSESFAELQWRISMPVACLLLGLLAVLLSKTNPREGRFGKLFLALLVYIAYVYSLMLFKSWVAQEKVPDFAGMWWVHLIASIYIIVLARKQFGAQWFKSSLTFAKS